MCTHLCTCLPPKCCRIISGGCYGTCSEDRIDAHGDSDLPPFRCQCFPYRRRQTLPPNRRLRMSPCSPSHREIPTTTRLSRKPPPLSDIQPRLSDFFENSEKKFPLLFIISIIRLITPPSNRICSLRIVRILPEFLLESIPVKIGSRMAVAHTLICLYRQMLSKFRREPVVAAATLFMVESLPVPHHPD